MDASDNDGGRHRRGGYSGRAVALVALIAFGLGHLSTVGGPALRYALSGDYADASIKRIAVRRWNATFATTSRQGSVSGDEDEGNADYDLHRSKTCDQYSGILIIDQVDPWAAAGTVFFAYVVNYLRYAEIHDLMPWIHFHPPKAPKVFDHGVHSGALHQTLGDIANISSVKPSPDKNMVGTDYKMRRAPPVPSDANLVPLTPNVNASVPITPMSVRGNGIWNTYFHHVSGAFNHTDPRCADKLLFLLDKRQVFPGMHYCAPWAVRYMDFGRCGTSLEDRQRLGVAPGKNESLHDWLGKQRRIAARLVKRWYRPHSWLQAKIDATNPRTEGDKPCLSIHIRLSDKGKDRGNGLLGLDVFLPYAEAFVYGGGDRIFVATDTSSVFDDINASWPEAVSRTVARQEGVFLSSNDKGIFDQVKHHRSNTEALVEIYAMAKCDLFVHGYSAMSEAVMYLKPELHDYSVDLDYPLEERQSVDSFRSIVREVLSKKRT